MSETTSHKQSKTKGLKKPKTEIAIPGKRRLDSRDKNTAREVERSGNSNLIAKAVRRLNTQKNKKKELLVLTKDLDKAKKVAEKTTKAKLIIQNLSRSRRKFINY